MKKEKLKGVTIPDSVTYIGKHESVYNDSLTSVTIPESVTHIDEYEFFCDDLTSIIIPNSVISIGYSAFRSNALTIVTIGAKVETIGDKAFAFNALTSVTIPDSVIHIGSFAFQFNELTSVTIPESVTTIGQFAFDCNALTDVFFKRRDITGATYDDSAFAYIVSKPTLYIPTGAVGYPEPSTTPVVWLGTTWNSVIEQRLGGTWSPVTTIGEAAFQFNELKDVSIPDSVKTIGDSMFRGEDSRMPIGENFRKMNKKITTPNSETDIGDKAFACEELESVSIPESVIRIGVEAFENNLLTSVTIPESVTSIGDKAFAFNALESVTFKRRDITGAYYDYTAFAYVSSTPTLYIPTGAVGYPSPSTTPVRWLGTTWSSVVELED